MMVALLAKIIGYEGPIADRSKTCFNIGEKAEPIWWSPATLQTHIIHQGQGVEEIVAQQHAALKRLATQNHINGTNFASSA